ncbi:MAG: hypothetical protein AB7N76_36345 [Planctomycetota bacterium]
MRRALTGLLTGLSPSLALVLTGAVAWAQEAPAAGQATALHPPVVLRNAAGEAVASAGGPVSPQKSCTPCHDAQAIAHGYHARAGLDELAPQAGGAGRRAWDLGPGPYGRWDPLRYERLGLPGEPGGLDAPGWLRTYGARHVGGGPGESPGLAGGPAELDCFLCHTPRPDVAARRAELAAGRFGWAATATLRGAGLVERRGETWAWQEEAFDAAGNATRLRIVAPGAAQCGACHGHVDGGREPLVLGFDPEERATEMGGTVFSAATLDRSGLNLAGKDQAARPWDVHAARLVGCADCHPPLNRPGARARRPEGPAHLARDPRQLDLAEFLRRPDHDLAKGDTLQARGAARLAGSMRGCAECHDAAPSHARWLPLTERHLGRLACAACHVPRAALPARRVTDWTVLTAARGPRVERRGLADPEADPRDPRLLLAGYEPALLPVEGRLTPLNLITTWLWVEGEPARPVARERLEAAWFAGRGYHPDLVRALDQDGDGRLAPRELRLDAAAKVAAVKARLEAVGARRPRIVGEVQPYELQHGVAPGAFAVKDCAACHSQTGRPQRPFVLASFRPAGATLAVVPDAGWELPGELRDEADGLVLRPAPRAGDLYLVGLDRYAWVDRLGLSLVLATALGVSAHGLLRLRARGGAA